MLNLEFDELITDDEAREEYEQVLCAACNGSGEGQYDGTRCSFCKGTGSESIPQ